MSSSSSSSSMAAVATAAPIFTHVRLSPKRKTSPTSSSTAAADQNKKIKESAAKANEPARTILYQCTNRIIGNGSFALVQEMIATEYSGSKIVATKIVALKLLNKSTPNYLSEINIMRDHCPKIPHTLQIYDHGDAGRMWPDLPEIKNYYALITELHQTNLAKVEMTLPIVKVFMREMLETLCGLKKEGVIHADIKPENLLHSSTDSSFARLSDFGMARRISNTDPYTILQSRNFRAPEVSMNLPITVAIDMWSLGCLLCWCLYKNVPFCTPGITETNKAEQMKMCKLQMRLIVEELGMPPLSWINSSPKEIRDYYFVRITDDFYTWNPEVNKAEDKFIYGTHAWEKQILAWSTKNSIPKETQEEILEFLRSVFVYENRITPEEAMQLKFFQASQSIASSN